MTQVQFFDGISWIGTDTATPYSMGYTGAALGLHSFTVGATKNSGRSN